MRSPGKVSLSGLVLPCVQTFSNLFLFVRGNDTLLHVLRQTRREILIRFTSAAYHKNERRLDDLSVYV